MEGISVSGDECVCFLFNIYMVPPPLPLMAFPPSLRPSTLIPFSSTKKLGVMISFLTSEREKTSRRGGGGFFHSLPPSAALSLSPLHSVPFIHIQQSIMFRKKKRERAAEGEGGIRRLQMEVVFFFHVLILPHLNRRCGKALGAPLYIAASLSSKAANRA